MFAAAADFDFPFGLAEAGLLPELTAAYQNIKTIHIEIVTKVQNILVVPHCDIMNSQH